MLLDETLIPLTVAAKEIPGRPSLCTVHRWTSPRARRRLDSCLVGGRRFTSREAIRRFIEAADSRSRNPAGEGFSNPEPKRARASDSRRTEIVERELESLGL